MAPHRHPPVLGVAIWKSSLIFGRLLAGSTDRGKAGFASLASAIEAWLSGGMSAIQARDVAVFETHRRVLTGLAYRMLGTRAEAEDVMRDAWLMRTAHPTIVHAAISARS